jgi:hypothetical protein
MFSRLTIISCFLFFFNALVGQEEVGGFYFGPKLGPTIGTQNWDGFDRRPMFNYHAAVFIESIDPDFKGAFFGQIGYHSRGSSLNFRNFIGNFNSEAFTFRNISVMMGAKKRLITNTLYTPYYFVGVRGEYQLSNNLQDIQDRFNSPFFPVPGFVNKWTYGISFGGGIEFLGSEFIQPAVELNVAPDLSFQYQSVAIQNVINPFNGQPTTLPERRIRNITIELSFVMRFMRRVVYIN